MSLETAKMLLDRFGYLFLFAGAYIDGLHVMLLGGFLTALQYLRPIPTFTALFLGDFLSDLMWFYLAYYGGAKVVSWTSRLHEDIPRHINKAKMLLEKHAGKIIFLAKFTFGIAIATILAAGISKMKPRKFIFFTFIANVILVFVISLLGYLFGESYAALSHYFEVLGYALLGVLVLGIIIFDYWNKKRQEREN